MTKATAIEFTAAESTGIIIRNAQDAQLGVVRGYKMASDPTLVAARKESNDLRIAAGTAKLLADLSK
jgi:hypothetical protein